MQDVDTIVIGASQAGLATSHELTAREVEHVVLEREHIGHGWQARWDSFCLVTPNWSARLPGFAYDGDDPDGFMPRDEIVAYLQRYAASFDAPVHEQTEARTVSGGGDQPFVVETGNGAFRSRSLVLATGAFQKPHLPAGADDLPASLHRLDVSAYSNAGELPPGGVLIIGSGQSGCQIAEELLDAGRRVVLACGRAPWSPRVINDRDIFWWLVESGFLEAGAADLPGEARLFANIIATGHDGGHDLNLRILKDRGVTLAGHFAGVRNGKAVFADDLAESVAWGHARHDQLRDVFTKAADSHGWPKPEMPSPEPYRDAGPEAIDLADISVVLFTGGFRPDYTSWLPWSDAFDDHGFPLQQDGTSTVVQGLHFVGTHFLRKRKSALMIGVGEDAGIVAEAIRGRA